MQNKGLIYVTVGVLVLVGSFFIWDNFLRDFLNTTKTPKSDTTERDVPKVLTYISSASSTLPFSLEYPEGYRVDDTYVYQFSDTKTIRGVKFLVPEMLTTSTNLSSYDSGIAVETLPRAKNCTGDIYLLDDVKAATLIDGGKEYSVASTTGAGAGNFYEEIIYALKGSSPCTAFRYFIHSTNVGNYEPGAVAEFDRAKLISDFDQIRRSFRTGTSATSTTP